MVSQMSMESYSSRFPFVQTRRGRVGGINFLYFPLIHHTYINKKVRLYGR